MLFDGGYASATRLNYDTYSFNYFYYNRDHLGNNREVVDAAGDVKQVTNYYPFGAPYADAAAVKGSAIQQYKYNGKELDVTHGLNTYDYGARQLDPILGRWDRMDPLCEKDYQTSPYVYCGNNPVNRVDKDGRIWDTFLDVAFLAYDLGEATYQLFTASSVSNTTRAALGADALAAVVPGLTGTGLAVRAGAKATDAGAKVNSSIKVSEKIIDRGYNGKIIRPNGGLAKPHGGKDHNDRIDKFIERLRNDKTVTNIRKNKKQFNVNGKTVGNNSPDIQFDKDGIHTNIEYDSKRSSSIEHKQIIEDNDPNARNKFYIIK